MLRMRWKDIPDDLKGYFKSCSDKKNSWLLRNTICWWKPNHMPSSVKDRFANSYEYVFMFSKQGRYWFDLDAVRESHQSQKSAFNLRVRDAKRGGPERRLGIKASEEEIENYDEPNYLTKQDAVHNRVGSYDDPLHTKPLNEGGKNPGDVWRITTVPHPFAHFACFPEELAEKCIKSGCPKEVCVKCGKPRQRITNNPYKFEWSREQEYIKKYNSKYVGEHKVHEPGQSMAAYRNWLRENGYPESVKSETLGWSDCGCNAGFIGGIVLDPFMGSGTVAVVAKRLGRQWLGIELNKSYVEIAEKRLAGFELWRELTPEQTILPTE